MLKRSIVWILIVVMVLSCVGLVACGGGGDDETPTEKESSQPGTGSGAGGAQGGVSTAACGDIATNTGGRKVDRAHWNWSGTDTSGYVNVEWHYYSTDDSVEDVMAFYDDEMTKDGWDKMGSVNMDQFSMSMWTKGDGEIGAGISAGSDDGKTGVAVWCGTGQGGEASEEATPEEETEETITSAEGPGETAHHEVVDPVHFSDLIKFLPDAPSGWEADDPEGATMTWDEYSYSMASRSYTNATTDEWVDVSIYDSAYYYEFPWLQLYEMSFEMETSDMYMRKTEVNGYPAWETWNDPDDYGLMILVADRFLVNVTAETKDSLELFSGLIDYDGLEDLS